MDEKINKLFGQALDKAVPETWTTLSYDQLMRVRDTFAELMVREVINVLDYNDGSEHHSTCLLEHFGVEE